MRFVATLRAFSAAMFACLAITACGKDSTSPDGGGTHVAASCPGIDLRASAEPARASEGFAGRRSPHSAVGLDTVRYQAEIAVRGTPAYTTSWSVRRAAGNKVNIWDVSGNVPLFVDSLIINGAIHDRRRRGER